MDAALTTSFEAGDTALLPARRRPQERPPDEPLWFEKPGVREVQEMETGRHLPVAAVMGSDYERLAQLRMNVSSQMRKDEPLYWRSLFNVAVVHLHQYPVIVVQGGAAA